MHCDCRKCGRKTLRDRQLAFEKADGEGRDCATAESRRQSRPKKAGRTPPERCPVWLILKLLSQSEAGASITHPRGAHNRLGSLPGANLEPASRERMMDSRRVAKPKISSLVNFGTCSTHIVRSHVELKLRLSRRCAALGAAYWAAAPPHPHTMPNAQRTCAQRPSSMDRHAPRPTPFATKKRSKSCQWLLLGRE